jgi:hypothetical protein
MKFFHSISLNKNVCPADFYNEVVRIVPSGVRGLTFHLEAQPGDEKNVELVEYVLAQCKERQMDKLRGAYSYLRMPHYEPSDFLAAPLLWLWTQRRMFKGVNSDQRDEQGRIVLPAPEAKPTIKIASIFPKPWIVVSDAVRRSLETASLSGLKFNEVSIKGCSMHAAPTPFWELRSTVTLSRMSNSAPDTKLNFNPVRYLIHDSYGEPHYRNGDLQPFGVFDIAHTFEPLSSGEPGLMVSQRFYQHCLKSKIPLEVRPVRIDPN